MSINYTSDQRRAIESRGRSLLVSAGAGSGKTRVLTDRLLGYIREGESMNRFLVITYTRAAAAEMRSRIMESIAAAAAEDPGDRRLRREQDLCYQAQIGTIHSFCTTVLRENSHLLGISPAFKVMEEERGETMRAAALERILDERYADMDAYPGFKALADSVGAGNNDARLAYAALSLHSKMRSHAYPEDWAAEQMAALDAGDSAEDIGATLWGRELLEGIKEEAAFHSERMDAAVQELYAEPDALTKAYGEIFQADAEALRDFVRALDEGWDRARELLPADSFARLKSVPRSYEDEERKERIKAVRDKYKAVARDFRAAMARSSRQEMEDLRRTAPAMKALLHLALDLDRAFAADKRRDSLMDFSDLEHYCADLLVDKATGKASWVAVELSQRYREIMVDEFQDVNAVQDMIFRSLSREGSNLFMVGDVKQSIYRFRLADPGIFLDKFSRFADYEDAAEGESARIFLRENFRSREGVLTAANAVFRNIMSRELGDIDYDENAALIAGAEYPESGAPCAELCLVEEEQSSDESPESGRSEARYVARRIRAMMDAAVPVWDKGVSRPCRWSDFALLLSAPKTKGSLFHRELAEAGIPVASANAGGFFTSLEVIVAVDMLAIIDNPHADVPLISVLRSPAFGFSADELALIRAADRSSDFYTALCKAAEQGSERCRDFIRQLEDIRALAPDMGLDALLWRIYTDTGLFSICSAMTDAAERRARLMSLFELARSFEESGYRGVFRFVAWLQRLAEKGREPARSDSGDAVSIMSIHKSKGLEFPFVFLCDLGHKFNTGDSAEAVLVHPRLGLGPKVTDTVRGIEYPSPMRRAIARKIKTENLSEELRVLYVAMTRAKERLIMTATSKNIDDTLEKACSQLMSPMPPVLLRKAQNFASWLIPAALLAGEDVIKLRSIRNEEGVEAAAQECAEVPADLSGEVYAELRAALDFRYPFAAATELPTKLTATELKAAFEPDGEARSLLPAEREEWEFRSPQLGERKLSAARRGTAAHTFMQYVELAKTGSREGLESELQRLVSRGVLTAEEAESIDLSAVEGFFASETGAKMRTCPRVYREFPFTLLADASEFFPVEAGEELLLQGIMDCLMVESDGLSIVDYKTDRVTAGTAAERARFYEGQLRAYARAAERIFSLPVKSLTVHFLRAGLSIEL